MNVNSTNTGVDDDDDDYALSFVPPVTHARFQELQERQLEHERREQERQQNPSKESILDPPGLRSKYRQHSLDYFEREVEYTKNRTKNIRVNRHRLPAPAPTTTTTSMTNQTNPKPKWYDMSTLAIPQSANAGAGYNHRHPNQLYFQHGYDGEDDRARANAGGPRGEENDSITTKSSNSTFGGKSWVPVTEERRDYPSADARRRQDTRAWQRSNIETYKNPYISWETRTALAWSVPKRSWTPPEMPPDRNSNKKKKRDKNNGAKPLSSSWAPHVDPDSPEALSPYPPQNAVAGTADDDVKEEEIIEESSVEIVDESGGPSSSQESESFVEIVDHDEMVTTDEDDDFNNLTLSKPQSRHVSFSSPENSDRSDDTNELFARGAGDKPLPGSTAVGAGTGDSANGSNDSTTSTVDVQDVEGCCDDVFSPIGRDDNFQVFDDNCAFAPTRGTIIIMVLFVICVAVWVGIAVWFFVLR